MRVAPATLPLALAALIGCQDPRGRCDTTADCASNERCDSGVCVRTAAVQGNGGGGGTDPVGFTSVLWTTLAASASASFAAASASADAGSGDVLVAGALAGSYDPWALGTAGFAVRARGGTGALAALASFPTFSSGALRAVALPGGELLFAARAVDPTTVGSTTIVPPAAGTLVLGRLDAAGNPVWVHPVDGTGAAADLAPAAVASRSGDLVVAGPGAGDFGCAGGDTAGATFAAALSGVDGSCLWSRGFANRSLADVEARPAGDVAVAGLCTPTGASFDPGGGTTCASGLFVAVLGAADGATTWARTSAGGAVTAVRDVGVAPTGAVAVVGDARGAVSFGGGAPVDFGTLDGSFVKVFDAAGGAGPLIRPVEAPTAPLPDAAVFDRCGYESAHLWIGGRYHGQPTLAGTRFTSCRDPCVTAVFLARLDPVAGQPVTGSFLPIRIARTADGFAWADDLVLAATTGTVSLGLSFRGDATVGASRWTTGAAGLGVVKVAP